MGLLQFLTAITCHKSNGSIVNVISRLFYVSIDLSRKMDLTLKSLCGNNAKCWSVKYMRKMVGLWKIMWILGDKDLLSNICCTKKSKSCPGNSNFPWHDGAVAVVHYTFHTGLYNQKIEKKYPYMCFHVDFTNDWNFSYQCQPKLEKIDFMSKITTHCVSFIESALSNWSHI